MPRDYYIEFHRALESAVENELDKMEQSRFMLGSFHLIRSLRNHLWYKRLHFRDEYDRLRHAGLSQAEAIRIIGSAHVKICEELHPRNSSLELSGHPWHDSLKEWRGRTIFFCAGRRNLEYLRPIISGFKGRCVVWSDADCTDEDWAGYDKIVLPLTIAKKTMFMNMYLAVNYPHFFAFAHTILLTLSLLAPKVVVCIDGCQTKYMIAAEYCRAVGIPSVCIQQGWPSFLHQGFRNWPYRYFLSWGNGFSQLLSSNGNQDTKFVSAGYPYRVEENSTVERDGIGFFLQERIFLASEQSERLMVTAIDYVSRTYPEMKVYVRRHPLRRNDDYGILKAENVIVADSMSLSDLYSKCKVVVSHFSSCIMESLIHGCVPIVIDPTSDSRYTPDIELEDLGYICESLLDFKHCLSRALLKEQKLPEGWFEKTGTEAVREICDFIGKL